MIKQALEYVVELKGGYEIIEQKGRTYALNKDGEITQEFVGNFQKSLNTSTLSSIVAYFTSDPDKVFAKDKQYIIRIDGVNLVDVMSEVSDEQLRDNLLCVRADLPERFPYERYMDLETFNILLQSRFEDTEDRTKLLALTANVVDETVKHYGDSGISQQATVRKGVATAANVIVPNPVTLKPFRTFVEAEQPESKFIFRLRKDEDMVTAALFEADGGAWKVRAITNIADFLHAELCKNLMPELMERITILA